MKTLIMISGTMGVGKTTTCRELQKILPRNVFLDGDWCWDMQPFVVNEETKTMVMKNICFQLKQFTLNEKVGVIEDYEHTFFLKHP